jgi:short-subunit dehydrogenase
LELKGRRILISGASRGLGRELALQCSRAGGEVIAVARNEKDLESLKREIEATSEAPAPEIYPCDLTDPEKTVEVLGRALPIDVAVFNAGVKYGEDGFFSSKRILETMEVNLLAVVRTLNLLLPSMMERNSGHLVFISSLGGYHGMIRANGYNASKAALSILADSLRMDLLSSGKNIAVTVVKPGLIQTEMLASTGPRFLAVSKEKAARIILKGILKEKEEIAFPKPMHLLSIAVSLLPKRWGWRLFRRVKP